MPKLHSLPVPLLLHLQLCHWQSHNHPSPSIIYHLCHSLRLDPSHLPAELNQFVIDHLRGHRMMVMEWLCGVLVNAAAMGEGDPGAGVVAGLMKMGGMVRVMEQGVAGVGGGCAGLQQRQEHEVLYTLASSVKYLGDKLALSPPSYDLACTLTHLLSSCPCACCQPRPPLPALNSLLFHPETLPATLHSHPNTNLPSLALLINANYYRNSRPIFQGASCSGAALMYSMIAHMVSKYKKDQLFSLQMLQSQIILQLFVMVLETRFLVLYGHWLQVMMSTGQHVGKSVGGFLRAMDVEFVDILVWVYGELIGRKYSQVAAVDLVKKLLLNRFLLNPSLYYAYASGQKKDGSALTEMLNRYRLCFYPKKCSSDLLYEAQCIESTLAAILTENRPQSEPQPHIAYHLDNTLLQQYYVLQSDLLTHNTSYSSLSFSFVAAPPQPPAQYPQSPMHSPSSLPLHTPSHMHSPHLHSDKNTQDMNSPRSQKSTRTVLTQHTERTDSDREMLMLEQLVGRRRVLGATVGLSQERKQRRAQDRQKRRVLYEKVHEGFNKARREIEAGSNWIRVWVGEW